MIHELFMQMTEAVAQYAEHGILGLGNIACGKHISDTTLKTDDVKTESAHQSVLRIGYQPSYLFRRSGQRYRHPRIADFAILPVLASAQTYQLMVERLTQHIGIVSVIRLQCLA